MTTSRISEEPTKFKEKLSITDRYTDMKSVYSILIRYLTNVRTSQSKKPEMST